jgi:hypothetical protein
MVVVPEWLSGMTRNHVGFARAVSNPAEHARPFVVSLIQNVSTTGPRLVNHMGLLCFTIPKHQACKSGLGGLLGRVFFCRHCFEFFVLKKLLQQPKNSVLTNLMLLFNLLKLCASSHVSLGF